jgi:putative SOS response-associated peptidase YedK
LKLRLSRAVRAMNARMSFGRSTVESALSAGWRRPRSGCLAEADCPSRLCLVADNDFRDALPSPAMPIGLIRSDANNSEWFALSKNRPLAVFAGIWTSWEGTRGTKAKPVVGKHQLFGFLTTEPNDVVGAIHPKAMPVILTKKSEIEQWMSAPVEDALKLQRPLADGALKIVATGERKDGAE